MKYYEAHNYLVDTVDSSILLDVLIEECAELIQAASKVKRTITKGNPTPVTFEEALAMLNEEFGDVLNVADVLRLEPSKDVMKQKIIRWAERLQEEGTHEKEKR